AADVLRRAGRRGVVVAHALVEALGEQPDVALVRAVDDVGDRHVAAGGQGVDQAGDALVGPVGLGDDVEDADEDEPDRLPEVEGGGGALEDLVGPAQVALDVGRRAVAAAQQRVRVGQDDRDDCYVVYACAE